MILLESAFVVLGLICVINAQSISAPPQHTSATVGNNVTLVCGVTGTLTKSIEWRRFDTNAEAGGEQLCTMDPGSSPVCETPQMYMDRTTYSLTLMNLAISDGSEYGCKLINNGNAAAATVLVAAVPSITAVPAVIEPDKNATFTCDTEFRSKPYDELTTSQQPTLTMHLAGSVVAETKDYTLVDGTQSHHLMTLTYVRLITIADADVELRCTISTVTSTYSESSSIIVEVHHAVTQAGLDEAEVKSYYTVDENVTCTADGFPEPTYTWVDLNDTSHTVDGPVLTFDTFTQGKEYFMVCRVRNEYNGATPVDSQVLGPFTVGTSPDGPPKVNVAGSNAWIAAAVIVPVVVIVAVILLVVFLIRRKRNKPATKAQTTQARPPTTNAYSNNNFNAANSSLRTGVNVNANPAGNPPPLYAYQGPYTGGQTPRAGRDSPGYGDLGARQFGGMVGMTPQSQQQQQQPNHSNSFNDAGSIRSDTYARAVPTSARPPPSSLGVANPAANTSRTSSLSSQHSQNAFGYQPTPAYQPTGTAAPYSRPSPSNQPRGVVTHSLDDSLV